MTDEYTPLPELHPDLDQYEPRIWDLSVVGPDLGTYSLNEGCALSLRDAAGQITADTSTVTFKVTATGAEARVLLERMAARSSETDPPTGCGGTQERNEE